jgi:hypothetical protein
MVAAISAADKNFSLIIQFLHCGGGGSSIKRLLLDIFFVLGNGFVLREDCFVAVGWTKQPHEIAMGLEGLVSKAPRAHLPARPLRPLGQGQEPETSCFQSRRGPVLRCVAGGN